MSEPINNLAQHLDPTTDKFSTAGIALLAQDHNPREVRDFYHKVGRMPDVHPAILYEVKKRGTEGDKLNRTFISLDESRVLEMGTHFIYVLYGNARLDPRQEDIELARETLRQMGLLGYTTSPITASDGLKVTKAINITEQIESLLGIHLAVPIKES